MTREAIFTIKINTNISKHLALFNDGHSMVRRILLLKKILNILNKGNLKNHNTRHRQPGFFENFCYLFRYMFDLKNVSIF